MKLILGRRKRRKLVAKVVVIIFLAYFALVFFRQQIKIKEQMRRFSTIIQDLKKQKEEIENL
ncbi:MAG: hypothetical protein LBK29_03245 [Oscillospiraceae bacterium]|jgi:hypothetical protein|nr:hypothetical protein [Oscillospiraceae bacterium]